MENYLVPCALCGSMPKVVSTYEFYPELKNVPRLGMEILYACPHCGLKSAPSLEEVHKYGRRLEDRRKLWNKTQNALIV